MKRFLSVALSAVLAMSAFCSVGTCVLADDYENPGSPQNTAAALNSSSGDARQIDERSDPSNVVSVEFTPVSGSYEIYEGTSCEVYLDSQDKEYYHYFPVFQIGDKIILHLDNGGTSEYYFDDTSDWSSSDTYIEASFNSDAGDFVTVTMSYDQSSEHWLPENEYLLTVSCCGQTASATVKILENPVSSIEFVPATELIYYENVNGYFANDNSGESYFYYYPRTFVAGDMLRVSYASGSEAEYAFTENGSFESSGSLPIAADDVLFYTDQYTQHWSVESGGSYIVSYLGRTCTVPVTITDTETADGFVYVVLQDGSARLVSYSGSQTVVDIPSTLGGHTLVSIGERAFENGFGITEVTVPSGVTAIGDFAFASCTDLAVINLPGSLSSVGRYAFYYCTALADVYYGAGEAQWNAVAIGTGNSCLTDADIHFEITVIVGDVDGDGELTDWDAIVLNRYLAGWEVEMNSAAADTDGDGELTDWDAIVLERYLAGWDIELNQ